MSRKLELYQTTMVDEAIVPSLPSCGRRVTEIAEKECIKYLQTIKAKRLVL